MGAVRGVGKLCAYAPPAPAPKGPGVFFTPEALDENRAGGV